MTLESNFFKMSKRQKGYIYLCKYEALERTINQVTEKVIHEGIVEKWKYGKTKNIDQRMKYYNSAYTLIEYWKVDHLTLREDDIHSDWCIERDRRENDKDSRDEHVNFDCYDIVKEAATCKIILKNDKIFHIDNNNYEYQSYSSSYIFDLLKIK